MTIDALNILLDELNAWKLANRTATLWWRDDDAALPCAELDRLIQLSNRHDIPCGLATIPTRSGEPLRQSITDANHLWILQHGYAHINHAPSGSGAWELGLHRPKSVVLEDLRNGMLKLTQLFKNRFVPVIVPPWNKIDSELFPYLPVMGFRGVSASYKKQRPIPPGDLRIADAHCDVLTWKKKEARFSGTEQCVADIVGHLQDKRTGIIDANEPTCILTHHLEMDEDAWDFMDTLFSLTATHQSLLWMSPVDIWPLIKNNGRTP